MKMKIIEEHGFNSAMLGLSLSYNQPIEKMPNVVKKLLKRELNGGELKFLEQIVVWLDITAPIKFWTQFDTYRIGIKDNPERIETTQQSESTMHTILKKELTQKDFHTPIYQCTLDSLNIDIKAKNFLEVQYNLPSAYIQRRIVTTNYKALIGMLRQRSHHKLDVWQYFYQYLTENLEQQEIVKELCR